MGITKVLKALSRFFGRFLLFLSVTLFILSFFAASLLNNTDNLKNSLINELTSDDTLTQLTNIDVKEVRKFCETDPENDQCRQLEAIKTQSGNNPGINDILNKIKSYSKYILTIRIVSFILFVTGFFFIFLGSEFSLVLSIERSSLSVSIASLTAAVYYKLLPKLLTLVFNSKDIQQRLKDFPTALVEKVKNILIDWFGLQINSAVKAAIILTIIFGLIFIVVKIYEKKRREKN